MAPSSAEQSASSSSRHLTERSSRYDEGRDEALGASNKVKRDGKDVTGKGLGIEELILGIMMQ